MTLLPCCMIIVEKYHAVVEASDDKPGRWCAGAPLVPCPLPLSYLRERNNGTRRRRSFHVQWTPIMSVMNLG